MLEALVAQFASIEDPRCEWRVEHRLIDSLVIAVCAVIGEAESFEDIALYGRCRRAWLERFLALPNGNPRTTPSGASSCWSTPRLSSALSSAGYERSSGRER
jgi:hypothetical protein